LADLWDEYSQYGDVVLESNGFNQYERHYTLANGMLIAQNDTSGSLYFLSDAQNSTRALTDDTGTVSSSYSYDAFGNLDGNPYLAETRYLYTGQQSIPYTRNNAEDPYAELYSLRARYYDPSIGRFMSRDTWAYNYGNPVELNRYVYAAGNPVRYTDPSGYTMPEQKGIAVQREQSKPSLMYLGLGVAAAMLFVSSMLCFTTRVCLASLLLQEAQRAQERVSEIIKEWADKNLKFPPNCDAACQLLLLAITFVPLMITNTAMDAVADWLQQPSPSIEESVATPVPTITPLAPTASPNPRRLHVALGLNKSSRILGSDGSPKSLLFFFTFNLNLRFNSERIYVYSYGDWNSQGLATSPISAFDAAFQEAMTNAERIHYNLEGIRGNPVDFANRYGNNGSFAGTNNFAATELYLIRSRGYCRKTTFWDNGSVNPTPNRIAWQQICAGR
jgi:RHS repeat-associated protein